MDLTIIIPARCEEFLSRTIQDVLENMEGDTEIIAILDGYLPDPPLPFSDKITIIYNPVSVGQRAGTNQAAKIAKGKYVMKIDAHCAFDKGFDRKMLGAFEEIGDDNITMIPLMKNLHIFDWVCPEGHRRYQSPSGVCETCGKPTIKDVVWIAKQSPNTFTFRFDKTMHFQYHGELAKDPENLRGVPVGFAVSFDPSKISPSVINFFTDLAGSHRLTCFSNHSWFRQNVSSDTMCFSLIDHRGGIGTTKIETIANKPKVNGITAGSIIADMIDNGNILSPASWNRSNEPSINDSVCQLLLTSVGESGIPIWFNTSSPIPTTSGLINADVVKKLENELGGNFIYNEKTRSFHNDTITLEPIYDKMLRETLSIQGSCFMATKEKYFELDLCSEEFHSWGQQGVEVACKTWMSGGRVISNLNTWYAHMFRTRGGDFGFPYSNPQNLVNENRELSRELFQRNKWPKAIHNFQWLLDKFHPPEWGTITKGIIYYTDNQLDEKIAKPVRDRLLKISEEKKIDITCSSLKRMDFGVNSVRFPSMKRGCLAMFKQILGALEKSNADIIFFCEHDVLYHPSHFDFTPPDQNTFYYNQNVWLLRLPDGHALHYDVNQLSGMCGWRDALIKHFRERYEMTLAEYERLKQLLPNENEFEHEFNRYVRNMGFEPFTHNRVQWQNVFKYDTWKSEFPNIDIKHGANATGQRWKKEEYRNQQLLVNWTESEDTIPGWPPTKELIKTLQLIAFR